MNAYYDVVFEAVKILFGTNKVCFYKENENDQLLQVLQSGTADFPIVLVSESGSYIAEENQVGIDLNNEVRVGASFAVTILSNDVDDIVRLEETITANICCGISIEDSDYTKQAVLKKDESRKAERKSTGTLYQTVFFVSCLGLILPKNIVSPIKIELDIKTQTAVMMHLCLLEETYYKVEEQLTNLEDQTDVNYDSLVEQKAAIERQIASMYTFEELCCETISLEDHGFSFCYNVMLNKNKNISDAVTEYKKKRDEKKREEEKRLEAERREREWEKLIQEEEEREAREELERINRICSKKGDRAINRYTDAIIRDMRERVSERLKNVIYGGSTYMEWFRQSETDTLVYPNVRVKAYSRFTFLQKSYSVETEDGCVFNHRFTDTALPIDYAVKVSLFSRDYNEINDLIEEFEELYTNEIFVNVAEPIYLGELIKISLCIDPQTETEMEMLGENVEDTVYRADIVFRQVPVVYYVDDSSHKDLENDHVLQLRLLQQAEFMGLCGQHLTVNVLSKLEKDYKALVGPKLSIFGFLYSEEFRALKNSFDKGLVMDPQLFNKVFSDITTDVPSLYDKTMQGWSYEQVREYIVNYRDKCYARKKELCEMLGIPQWIKGVRGDTSDARLTQALNFYMDMMLENEMCPLSEALSTYSRKMIHEEKERERQMQLRAQMRAEMAEDDDSDSGGSLLGSIVGAAVAVEEMVEKKQAANRVGKGRRDLFGSHVCRYGQKDEHGWTIHCGLQCSVANQCTQRGRYKEGS